MMGTATITCLLENRSDDPRLKTEHGLSLWVTVGGRGVLFDTGQSAAFAENAKLLGVDISRAEAIVLSHGHYDHTGGLAEARSLAASARVFAHPSAVGGHFKRSSGRPSRYIGMPGHAREGLEAASEGMVLSAGPTEVVPGVMMTGEVPRRYVFEERENAFFADSECLRADSVPDDQALFFDCGDGVVVVTGCAHAGVVNTVAYVAELAKGKRIYSVVGGMHLRDASAERLARTTSCLKDFGVERVWAGHCTGAGAEALLAKTFGDGFTPLKTGATMEWH